MSKIKESILELIGDTPLLKLTAIQGKQKKPVCIKFRESMQDLCRMF